MNKGRKEGRKQDYPFINTFLSASSSLFFGHLLSILYLLCLLFWPLLLLTLIEKYLQIVKCSIKINLSSLVFFFSQQPVHFPGDTSGKESACQCKIHRDMGSILGSGRYPGEGNGSPLQYSWDSGKSHGQKRLAGYSQWGLKEPNMTKQLSTTEINRLLLILIYLICIKIFWL